MKKIIKNWQKHLIAITWSFVFVAWLFSLNSVFFQASITSPDFKKYNDDSASSVEFDATWYDIAIDKYIWASSQNWALNISTWNSQSWILAISFKIKYSPSEVLVKQIIDPVWIKPDFIDVDVDNQNWVAEINVINSDSFDIWENTEFIKLDLALNQSLVQWDQVHLKITDVEIVDDNMKINQWKWKEWLIKIIEWDESNKPNLLAINSLFKNWDWEAEVVFNDYIKTLWSLEFTACDRWSSPTLLWSISKKWKSVAFTATWIISWEICRIKVIWFEWNTKNWLKENYSYISWYNFTWASITWVLNVFKNSFKVQFTWWEKLDIENPTNYKLLKWDSFSPTSWEVIKSINYDEVSKIATFEISKILDKNQRYTLIANLVPWMSSNKIFSFVTENTWEVELISIGPNICNLTWCSAVVQWNNLTNVNKFLIWDTETILNSKEEFSASIDVPAMSEWKYDLIAIDKNNKRIILENVFTFTNKEVQKMAVNSTWSYASPARILNNWQMPTTLWTVISWINWVNDINRVTVDLRPIWWSPVAQMNRDTVVDWKIWFNLDWVVAHPTAQTWDDPVQLEITAEDTNWVKAYWTIYLYVTNNLILSAAPELDNPSVIYDRENRQIDAFVKVTDDDWITDVQTVTVDLTSLWLWYQVLHSIDTISQETVISESTGDQSNDLSQFERNEKKTSVFRLESPLNVPSDKKIWKYNFVFSAYDKTWEEASIDYEFNYTWWSAPEFTRIYDRNEDDDNDNQYVYLSRWKVPNDWYTSFDLSTTVKDEDGADDIVEVRADLTRIWWDVVILERQWSSTWTNVKSAIFTLKWITIPSHVTLWWHEFDMVAHDRQWNQTVARVEIKVTETDEQWKHIEVVSEKGYTQPPIAQAWTWTVSLNVYVKNNWKEIKTVIAYLENIAKHVWGSSYSNSSSQSGSTTSSWSTQSGSLIVQQDNDYCENQNDRIVCMEPSVKEWRIWQWFRLDDVQVLAETQPSTERYRIKVKAIEQWGAAIEWWTYITVGDWTLPVYDNGSPKLQMAISTSENSVQLVFSNPLEKDKIKSNYFKITNAEDIKDTVAVKSFTMSSDHTVVTLNTWDQIEWRRYTVVADAEKIWLKEDSFTDNHKEFIWFDKDAIAPQLYKIETLSSTHLALYFDQWITPSSIEKNADNFKIFTADEETKALRVLATEFADDNNKILYLSTEDQVMNQDYILLVKNVVSAAWVPIWWYERKQSRYAKWRYFWITEEFVWYRDENLHASAMENWLSNFDISNSYKDDCIDFKDFTMFTKDYSNWLPSSEYFDYNFDNKLNFIDFTVFTTEYWKCKKKEEKNKEDNSSSQETWTWEQVSWSWETMSWTWQEVSWSWEDLEIEIEEEDLEIEWEDIDSGSGEINDEANLVAPYIIR